MSILYLRPRRVTCLTPLSVTTQPDADYPPWLWTLLDPELTREELRREAEGHFADGGDSYDAVLDNMDEKKLIRLFRLDQRARIKEQNSLGGL